jgi:hypothetical protein
MTFPIILIFIAILFFRAIIRLEGMLSASVLQFVAVSCFDLELIGYAELHRTAIAECGANRVNWNTDVHRFQLFDRSNAFESFWLFDWKFRMSGA